MVAGFLFVARGTAVIELAELIQYHGRAFRGLFGFGFGRVKEDRAPELADVMAA